MSVVIPKGTKYPCAITKKYTNGFDNQTELKFDVYEGDSEKCIDNKIIRELSVALFPGRARS